MASRLPRLHSSPPPAVAPSSKRKRKISSSDSDEELEGLDQPRKLPAIGAGTRPTRGTLQPSRSVPNGSKPTLGGVSSRPGPSLPKPLTRPHAPPSRTTTRSASAGVRGTSAPPPSSSRSGARVPSSGPATRTRNNARVASTGSRPLVPASAQERKMMALQSQLASIEEARASDVAQLNEDMDLERAKVSELQANHAAISRELAAAKTHEINQRRELMVASEEVDALKRRHAKVLEDLEDDLRKKEKECRATREELDVAKEDLEKEKESNAHLKAALSQQSSEQIGLQTQITTLQGQVEAYTKMVADLKQMIEDQRQGVEDMKRQVFEGELVRRKLHNMVQELKGNIRVFARVRPILSSDSPSASVEDIESAELGFPDAKDTKTQITLASSTESAMGQERRELYNFSFDRVFVPGTSQSEVFEEIAMLTQSCIDGYNVCIFAYGQTGSGKSYTMEGGRTDIDEGMIPRAVELVFKVTDEMKSRGWEYSMEGQFLEIYNETINDLLGSHEFDKKKHEIKHDLKAGSTRVTDVTVVPLRTPTQVRGLLNTAQKRRSVAATMVNERSSRSHSVFTLRIKGININGDKCEGCLNLVDLAGSERLNVSFAGQGVPDKERLKETQSINKSLSALGDVIAALGEKGATAQQSGSAAAEAKHIPYRNSKLTYLLQNSLSGNSKTLVMIFAHLQPDRQTDQVTQMFLNLSPLAAHLNESLTSLRFATKVNNTQINIGKKQSRS